MSVSDVFHIDAKVPNVVLCLVPNLVQFVWSLSAHAAAGIICLHNLILYLPAMIALTPENYIALSQCT